MSARKWPLVLRPFVVRFLKESPPLAEFEGLREIDAQMIAEDWLLFDRLLNGVVLYALLQTKNEATCDCPEATVTVRGRLRHIHLSTCFMFRVHKALLALIPESDTPESDSKTLGKPKKGGTT